MKKTLMNRFIFLTVLFYNGLLLAEEMVPITLDGVELVTVIEENNNETAKMVIEDFLLPNEDVITWPYILNADLQTTNVSATFNGIALTIINSETLSTDIVESLVIDIEDFKGEAGELIITLESTGDTPATLFLIKFARSPSNVPIITYLLN